MKKLDNFSNCLKILKNADFELADSNEIYRTGVIGQFNLTSEICLFSYIMKKMWRK